jgi:hypothetical protein
MTMTFLALALLAATPDAGVTTITWDERSAVKVVEGATLRVQLKKAPTRVGASEAAVCEVVATGDMLELHAKKPGTVTVALFQGFAMRGLQVVVLPKEQPVAPAADAGVAEPFFTWDGQHGFVAPRATSFVIQGPGGLERVAPGSHRRCHMESIGNDQLRFRCDEAGAVTVFLWYANNLRRTLELDVAR